MTKYSPEFVQRRRTLRTNSTPQERILWRKLQHERLGVKFRRQHPVGNFILDFYCPSQRLAIEIDGYQHAERVTYDEARTAYLKKHNITVLRYSNADINVRLEGVLIDIVQHLASPPPPYRFCPLIGPFARHLAKVLNEPYGSVPHFLTSP